MVKMFGINILKSKYCDAFDDGTQYFAEEWYLNDMKKYKGKYVIIGFNGDLVIYEDEGTELLKGTLLDSKDFVSKLKEKLV